MQLVVSVVLRHTNMGEEKNEESIGRERREEKEEERVREK